MSRPRHFLDLDGFETATLRRILARAGELKRNRDGSRLLEGRALAMIFEKPWPIPPGCCRAMSMRS